MSNQQGMFYPQDHEPQEPEHQRRANNDPREQSHAQQQWDEPVAEAYSGYERGYGDYNEGYGGPNQYQQEQLTYQQTYQQSSATRPGLQTKHIIAIIVGVIILSSILSSIQHGGFFSFFLSLGLLILVGYILIFHTGTKASIPSRVFMVQDRARLVVKNPAGAIRVVRGQSKSVEVSGTQNTGSIFGSFANTRVEAQQDGDTISIATHQTSWRPSRVDLEIKLPPDSDIQIEGNAGTIVIDGVEGETIAETNAGVISVNNSTLRGNSRLKTNAGTITFNGTIATQGTIHMESNVGTVNATIADNSSFVIEAKTDLGNVNNHFGNNIVGTPPYGRLELYTNVGTINVMRKS